MKNKFKIYFFIAVILFFIAFPVLVKASDYLNLHSIAGGGTIWISDGGESFDVTKCVGDQFIDGNAVTSNQASCIAELIQSENKNAKKQIDAYIKKRKREEWWEENVKKRTEVMAGAFKKSLENMARQIGKDTAVWVASGGRGQKPLFITEGWGAYVKNAADVALGDFIDQVGREFDVDLCEPNFNVKLAIMIGIDDRQNQTRRVRCSFSDIMSNWESAISNANFSVEYRAALRPGENDISVALMLADRKIAYVSNKTKEAEKEAEIPKLWKNIKDISGQILTPGTMIHDEFKSNIHDETTKLGWGTFTDTFFDLLGSFMDTLVGQLALNLKNGFFSSNSVSREGNGFNMSNLNSLFSPWSSPVVAGVRGAEDKFGYLKTSTIKVGGQYDLLSKLTVCQDLNNPGPMECVIDIDLATAIRQEVLVKDLPSKILDRPFIPLSNSVESSIQYFSLRGITILRKYRIVPVGWEYAANLVYKSAASNSNFKAPTLGEIMNNFNNHNSIYFGLIDPFWVMKAPDMFCRREGSGPHNSFFNDQGGTIFRNDYCADEQQCIKENDDGSCAAYGYCTEERRIWKFGKTCDVKFNTCNTYVNRNGITNYWLTNSLDFRDCDQSVVGCRWFSTEYNPISQYWVGSNEGWLYKVQTNDTKVAVDDSSDYWLVQEGHYVSRNKRLIMAVPCSEVLCKDPVMNDKCSFINQNGNNFCQFQSGLECQIPKGGVNCRLPICDSEQNAFASGNGGFESYVSNNITRAEKWSNEYYSSADNQMIRDEKSGKSGAGLKIFFNGAPSNIILTSDAFSIDPESSYHLKFDIQGRIYNKGRLSIIVYGGDKKITPTDLAGIKILDVLEIGAGSNFTIWNSFRSLGFKNQGFSTATIAIKVTQGTFANINLDNISLNQVGEKCFKNSVTVFSELESEKNEHKNIYFDRDAQGCSPDSAGCSEFKRFKNDQSVFLKKAPDYFNCYYYKDATSSKWPTNASELNSVLANRGLACSEFAGVCLESEVGCELYKPLNGDPVVPGVANDIDVCPQECVGYQVYKQEDTRFVNGKYLQFIADDKLKYCSASYVGCDEFTNLDELGKGAETKEYYSYIRACQKPGIDDGAYYTWEGSDTVGYQLKAYNLKKSNIQSNGVAPCTKIKYNSIGNSECDDSNNPLDSIGSCSVADLVTNPDCRQFYDVQGNIHYKLLSHTISVSNNCHPYRRTGVETKDNCELHSGWWKDGSECVYMAIPKEGVICPASAKGCRAYTGNRSNNVRNLIDVANFGLQASTTGGWMDSDGATNGLFVSSESTFPGGNSLTIAEPNTIIKHPVQIKKGKAYILSFWAKGDVTGDERFSDIEIKFSGTIDSNDYFLKRTGRLATSSPEFTKDWKLYELGPVFVSWNSDETKYLEFSLGLRKIYLDNVILKEVVNRIYAVENSWYTPSSCDNKLNDKNGSIAIESGGACDDSSAGRCFIGEMLGCAGYTTRANQVVYLKSFASLCRPDAVGCEKLTDTKNNKATTTMIYHDGDASKVIVPADETVYLVNRPEFTCPSFDIGCTPYGLPIIDQQDNVVGYQSVFIKNQPDRYESDLCFAKNLWCDEYVGDGGAKYFKEPHNKICVYGVIGSSTVANWYKIGTKELCSTTPHQSYGNGYGDSTNKKQPIGVIQGASLDLDTSYKGWVGACSQAQSGCTEFVDPLVDMYVEERGKVVGASTSYSLKANTLYTIFSEKKFDDLKSNDCKFISQEISASSDSKGYLYYAKPNDVSKTKCDLTVSSTEIKVVKTGVYYKLANSVDKSSCDGLVDFGIGCVLFNNRSEIDYSSTTLAVRNKYLNFDAQYTYFLQMNPEKGSYLLKISPKTAQDAWNSNEINQNGNNADVILKVNPNRTCSNWLSCSSYIKGDGNDNNQKFGEKDYCLSVIACDELGDDNQCSHFAISSTTILDLSKTTDRLFNLNKTGYSVLGLYPVDQMSYLGQVANIGNGNFETVLASGKPLGWNPWAVNKTWDPSQFSVVTDSKTAPEGRRYLRTNFKWTAKSEEIDVIPGQTYYLSAYINTESLKSSSSTLSNERAEIVIMSVDGSEIAGRIMVPNGLGWSHQVTKFTTPGTAIYLLLRNSPDVGSGAGADNGGEPVGYSLFDDIQINPVLEDNGDGLKLSKTCRIYPSSDAPACQYSSGGTNYSGWYGYCLTPDPIRRSNCLQWFPVDKIKGELNSDYSLGYDNRRPLYYCVDWDIVSINISGGGLLGNIGENIGSDWKSKISSIITDNRRVTTVAFDVNPEYASFMRYPYVNRFLFLGGFGGISEAKTKIFVPMNALMYPNCSRGVVGFLPFFFGDCSTNDKHLSFDDDFYQKSLIFDCIKKYMLDEGSTTNSTQAETTFWYHNFCKYYGVGTSNRTFGVCTTADLGGCNDYYGQIIGTPPNGINAWNTGDSSQKTTYKCLPNKTIENWGDDDMKVRVSDACNELKKKDDIKQYYGNNEQTTYGNCDRVLDEVDHSIEECIKDTRNDLLGQKNGLVSIVWNFFSKITNSIGGIFWDNTDRWGGWGALGFTLDGIGFMPIVFAVPWNWAMKAPSVVTTITALVNVVTNILGLKIDAFVLGFGVSGVKIITDEDSVYGSSLTDPDPDVPGNILGYAWLLNTSEMHGAGILGSFSGYMNIPYCKAFVKTVESSGQNKAYYSKVGLGSDHNYEVPVEYYKDNGKYVTTTNKMDFTYNMDYMPFGALVPPATGDIDSPITWDSKTLTSINQGSINLPGVNIAGLSLIEPTAIGINYSSVKQPLFFEPPVLKYGAPYQARAGGGVIEVGGAAYDSGYKKIGVYLNSTTTLRGLFAKNYGGVFEWKWDKVDRYNPILGVGGLINYVKPLMESDRDVYDCVDGGKICEPQTGFGGSYKENLSKAEFFWDDVATKGTGIQIKHIASTKISKSGDTFLYKLTFTVEASVDQLPLKSYVIAWGDGEVDTISGISFNDKPNVSSTFTVYHVYDYTKVRALSSVTTNGVDMHCCYKVLNGQNCKVISSNIPNKPKSDECNDDSCKTKIHISIRDSWDKVNYCDNDNKSNFDNNTNFIEITMSGN